MPCRRSPPCLQLSRHRRPGLERIEFLFDVDVVVEFAELPVDATVDLRTNAGDPGSSVAQRGRSTSQANKVMLLVEDDDLEGKQVRLVVAARDETLLIDHPTTVGRND